MEEPNWGPAGRAVYDRTYSRPKRDGSRETWWETVERVVEGNIALVPGDPHLIPREREDLIEMIGDFRILPAGRHLWATGVPGAEYLFNCWASDPRESSHHAFLFQRLLEGGGVGANYTYVNPTPIHFTNDVHIVCDPSHADYESIRDAGVLSDVYSHEWTGTYVIDDSREGWVDAAGEILDYARAVWDGPLVFDISHVRPKGSAIRRFGGTASGPLPLARALLRVGDILRGADGRILRALEAMAIDHALAECVISGGVRRSARMSILHWKHPEIFDFLAAKSGETAMWSTNISVEVDDEFWEAVSSGDGHARDILSHIASGMLLNGEPGIWNSSLSNAGEPNRVVTTNPCGEIALQPWEPCNLGHVNLGAFDDIDVDGLVHAHVLITRFLMRATFGQVDDPQSRAVLDRNRRIGVGHTGLATHLARNGVLYSEAPHTPFANTLRELKEIVDAEAIRYAHELRIPVPVKTTTVAPVGSVSKLAGVSEGIHPIYARHFIRRIRFNRNDPNQWKTLLDYSLAGMNIEKDMYDASGATWLVEIPTRDPILDVASDPSVVESVNELSVDQMLGVQLMYQELWADNAVSFTVNVEPGATTVEELCRSLASYGPRLKGTTVMVDGTRPQAPYERLADDTALGDNEESDTSFDENCASGACPIR